MVSLQKAEAVQRASLLEINSMHIAVDLTGDDRTFTSTSTISFSSRRTGTSTFCDFAGEELLSVELNGTPVPHHAWQDNRIRLARLANSNVLTVTGRMAYSSDGEGLHRHVDPADGRTYLYAMSFLDAAPRWFACFDQPDLKTTVAMTVRAPRGWTVLGNGRFTQTEPGLWELFPTPPLATYFITLVAGPYASVLDEVPKTATSDPVMLGLHAKQSLATELQNEAADLFAVTRASFGAYHDLFGVPYAFGDYHQVFVPDFNAGAMENPGCVTFRDSYLFRGAATEFERGSRACTVAHELAHQWFGDLVTMRWWDDLWLNESFAEYLAHRVCSNSTRYPLWVDFGINRKDWGMVADQSPSTHPVAGNGAVDAAAALADFDGISYAKGAALLKQLVAHLGDEVFLAGLRDYIGRYQYRNAELAELLRCWTRAGADNLSEWSQAWLTTTGADTLRSVGGRIVRTGDERREHRMAVAALDTSGSELDRLQVRVRGDGVDPGLSAAVVVPDAADQTWASIRFDDELSALASISAVADPLTRVVLWNSLRDSVRNAELDPGVVRHRVVADLPDDPSDQIVRSLLGFAADELVGHFTPMADRPERLQELAAVAEQVMQTAAPGTDRQLVGWQQLIRTGSDVERLTAWLSGENLPRQQQLDDELRWAIVTRLAELGHPEQIEVLARQDSSASARNHAAHARAATPDAEAKARALRIVTEPNDLSAYEVYATASGLFASGSPQLLVELAEQWFDRIAGTARFRTGWALGTVIRLSFPVRATSPQVLARAERQLGAPDLVPLARRALVDGTDKLRRAVAVTTRFPA
ncbi:aminopeptidase N [Naumannella halotolerans]|uniref:aminopeptidase N n=1 Tax=Naumannella halotolerans TaxID=993414 RepID=UPI00370D6F72